MSSDVSKIGVEQPVVRFAIRPTGVTVLTVLAGLLGVLLSVAYVVCIFHWEENNRWAMERRMPPPVFWGLSGLGVALAIAATIGMGKGTRWGWWLASCGMVMSVIHNFGQAGTVNFAGGLPKLDTFISKDSVK